MDQFVFGRSLTADIHGHPVYSANKWYDRLQNTRIDQSSKDLIWDLEEKLINKLEKDGNPFVKSLQNRDTISVNDLTNGVLETHESTSSDVKETLDSYLKQIREKAREQARKLIGKPKVGHIVRTAGTFEDSVEKAFSEIDGIPSEIIQKIKDEWMQSGGQQNIIPQLIKKEVEEYKADGHTKKELRDALHSLWEKQKTVYKRTIRTTTINTYASAQLEEWDSEGILEVERHCIDDHRTCQICRALCAPGRNRYRIKDLLQLNDPITYASHPQCRDFYTPVIDWTSLDSYFTEPMVDVEIDDAQIKNMPTAFQEQIGDLAQRVNVEGVIEFVPDIVDTEEWLEDKYNEFRDSGYGQRESLEMATLERENLRGQIVSYEHPEKTLISGQAVDGSSFAYSLVLNKAQELWTEADKKEWRSLFEERTSADDAFISFDAEKNPESYFIESYIAFVTNPFRLITIDETAYTELAELTGQDFFELGAVR